MKLEQQPPEAIRDRMVEAIGIGSLVLFGVVMVFFGWLKYRERKNPKKTKPPPETRRKGKRK